MQWGYASLQHIPPELLPKKRVNVTWIIQKVNRIPTHCDVTYESVHSLAIGHVIRVWVCVCEKKWLTQSMDFLTHHFGTMQDFVTPSKQSRVLRPTPLPTLIHIHIIMQIGAQNIIQCVMPNIETKGYMRENGTQH